MIINFPKQNFGPVWCFHFCLIQCETISLSHGWYTPSKIMVFS